ncbi:hypothetical protein BJ165DRAFT_1451898 [Panaeolus papilionaceus]|nr:hypothetical protein BJ165DRAFT_1451898 [Panaeolus papilionaceus]
MVKKSVYIAVIRALHGRLLFPNLRRVQINITCELHTICTAIPLLYSPHLIHVSIMKYGPYEPCWSKDASAFIQRLGLSETNVRQLCLEAPLSQFAMDVLPSITSLSDIYLDADPNVVIKLPFLVFLSTLDTLTDLHLRFYASDFESQSPRKTLSFNKLKHASICCQFNDILTLLEFARFPRIYTFAHEFDVPENDEPLFLDWARYLNAVAKAGPKAKQLCLRPFRVWPPSLFMTFFDEGYPGVTFAPLLNSLLLFNLQVLRFDFDMISCLTKNDFERMTLAWPNLKELDLRSTMTAEKCVDTSIFELIAKGFPNLLKLTICVDASQVEEATILVSNHPLESMDLTLMDWEGVDTGPDSDSEDDIQDSRLIQGRLENTTKLAMLLDSCFPDLSELDTGLESCLPIVWECLRSARLAERRRHGIEEEYT